jgi:hypothetical protein
MTPAADKLLELLAAMPSPLPDAVRAERARARCCAALVRTQRRSERLAVLARVIRDVIAPAIAAALCAAGFGDMVDIAVRTLTI